MKTPTARHHADQAKLSARAAEQARDNLPAAAHPRFNTRASLCVNAAWVSWRNAEALARERSLPAAHRAEEAHRHARWADVAARRANALLNDALTATKEA